MVMAIFTEVPEVEYEYGDSLAAATLAYAGSGKEQRAQLQEHQLRTYTWPMRRTASERATIDAFFRARFQTVESFLVKEPKDFARTAVSLGTSIASQTVFPLPSTGEEGLDYPVDDEATFIVYDDGAPVGVASIDTDGRTVTLDSAPATSSVMTADYHYYRRVKLVERFQWRWLAPDWCEAIPNLAQVIE